MFSQLDNIELLPYANGIQNILRESIVNLHQNDLNPCQPRESMEKKDNEILNILEAWEVPYLYPTLLKNKIELETLKYMQREDVHDLLQHESLGTKIHFTHHLQQWQVMQGIHIQALNNKSSNSTNVPLVGSESNPIHFLNTPEKIYLKDILRESAPGYSLLGLSDNRKLLSDENRYTLVDIIVSYFINRNLRMGVNECQTIANDIEEFFEGEVSSVYFLRRPNMKSKGHLYDRYNNRISKLRNADLMPKTKRIRSSTTAENSLDDSNQITEDSRSLCMELKFNRDDNKLDEILSKWSASTSYRLHWIKRNTDKNIGSIIEEWPAYEQAYGPKLITIDFESLYPDASNIFISFERFCTNVLPIMEQKVMEQISKQILKEFKAQQHISSDAKFSIVLMLLHALIKPTTKSFDIVTKKLRKTTIKDSQNSFMVLCQSSQDLDVFLEEKKQTKLIEKKPMQPCMFVIGLNFYSNNTFFVICDNIKYKCSSILSALDCTFKLFHVLNLKYPDECKAVWQFIQEYLYKIQTPYDDGFPSINLLISKLKKFEN